MKNTKQILLHIKERFALEDRLMISMLNLKEMAEENHHWKEAQMYDTTAGEHQAKKMELANMYSFILDCDWMNALKDLYAYAKEHKHDNSY